jgi:hypothetical protein
MTTRQYKNSLSKTRFGININKLTVGRSLSLWNKNSDGSKTLVATVRCDTVGERPRRFSVTNSHVGIPVGSKYTIGKICENLYDDL